MTVKEFVEKLIKIFTPEKFFTHVCIVFPRYYHDEYYCSFHENFSGLDAIEQFKESEKQNRLIEQFKKRKPIAEYCITCQRKYECNDNIYNNIIWCPNYKEK